jgi:hypothetical protein
MGNSMDIPPKKKTNKQNRNSIGCSNLITGYISKCKKSVCQRHICISLFIAALFTIVKRWKHPECSLTDEWKNKKVVHI